MNRKTVRIVALGIVVALVLSVIAGIVFEVYAVTEEEQIKAEQEKKNEAEKNLEETKQKKEKSLAVMEGLEKEVGDIQLKIDALNKTLNETSEKLEKEEKNLEDATNKAENQYDVFKERFRIMCEQGDVSFIEMLLSADDFNTLIDKAEVMKEISEYDKKVFDMMENNRQKIEISRDAIAELKKTQEEAMGELEGQKDALEDKKSEQEAYMAELESDAEAYQKVIDDADAAMEEIRRKAAEEMKRQEEERRKAEEAKRKEAESKNNSESSGSSEDSGSSGESSGKSYTPSGSFTWPTPSCHYITSHFSPRRKNPVSGIWKRHTGTDIGAGYGTQIVAADSGTVTLAGWNSGYGYCVIINHGNGRATLYAHMSSYCVSAGQSVQKGQHIGNVGSTGNSTGPHLHFEVMINGEPVNPMQFF